MHEDANRHLLISAARRLRPLLDELVFVGGSVAGLLITDPAVPSVRVTIDVDAIAEITSYYEYAGFASRLRACGFTEDTSEGAPPCRWKHHLVTLDVMPLDQRILGFSNRWYKEAAATATRFTIEPLLDIRIVRPPFFLATKIEAFKGRGRADYLASHDLEDVLAVIDGRPELAEEVHNASVGIRDYLAQEFRALLEDPRFIDALPAHLQPDAASQSRIPMLLQRMEDLAR